MGWIPNPRDPLGGAECDPFVDHCSGRPRLLRALGLPSSGPPLLYAPRVLVAVLILVFGAAAADLLARLTRRALGEVGVNRTGRFRTLVRFGVIFVAAILAAAVLGIDVTILIVVTIIGLGAAALAAALALGLGLRGLSQNVAAGRYVSEGIAEGDEISLNGISGTVESIGHAMTTVRGSNGRVYLIPNTHFLDHVVEKQESAPEQAQGNC